MRVHTPPRFPPLFFVFPCTLFARKSRLPDMLYLPVSSISLAVLNFTTAMRAL
jgi:hypothetical protein